MKKIIILMAAIMIGCGGSGDYTPINYASATIIQKQGTVFVNGNPIELGQKINKDDKIKTTANSFALMDIENIGKIYIKPNTEIQFQPYSKETIEIVQPTGRSFSKIDRKGANYTIVTPTTVAGVRGTSFEVETSNKKTNIKLLEGKLIAYRKNDSTNQDKIVYLEPLEKIEITEKETKVPVKISKKEAVELHSYEKAINTKTVVEPQARITNQPKLTLADIKAKFGRLSIVTLKNGTVYKGSFYQKGNIMTIITPSGTFNVKTIEIAKVTPLD